MNTHLKIKLLTNEAIINSWDVYYTFDDGLCFFGLITVTNKRLLFDTKINGAIETMLKASPLLKNHISDYVILQKKHITQVEILKDTSGNKAVMIMDNGEKHILDRKMLAIEQMAVALNSI
ncbi:MAG TPA: hypothetical protein PKL96_08705 [Bacteroidales bacterium]|nr:hypothetical protein [Bacteroidales bacterium]HPS27621.1 hypothetical protein [Bacteroidales bacterium]